MSGSWPIHPCQSLRHRPVASTRTTAPCAAGTGSSTVSTVGVRPKASYTTARTRPSLDRRAGPGAPRRTGRRGVFGPPWIAAPAVAVFGHGRGRPLRRQHDGGRRGRGHRPARRGPVDADDPRPARSRAGGRLPDGAAAARPGRARPRDPLAAPRAGRDVPAPRLRPVRAHARPRGADPARLPRRRRGFPPAGRRGVAVAGARARAGGLPQRLRALQPDVRGRGADRRDRLRSRLAGPAGLGHGLHGVPLRPIDRPGESRRAVSRRGRAGAPAGGVLCGLRRRADQPARGDRRRDRPICASSSRSSCAPPPPATPRSRRCWPAATPRSTSATSPTSSVYSAEAIRSTISATSSGLVPKFSRT